MTAQAAPRGLAEKYDVVGVLGEGGTGVVYDARKKDDGRSVALKVMHPHLAGDLQIRGRFQREAAILRRLEGEHICTVVDFGEVDGDEPGASVLYLALPKVEGPSLEALLRREAPLAVDRAVDVMVGVCRALSAAHAQGVVHRDLKPANVILEERGGREHVIVVDFGLSKIVTGTGTGTTNLTTGNMVFGTPEYMAPEQARGDEIDARCDVYACGAMLYELLTGTPPFTGPSPLSVLTAHLTSDVEPPSRRAPAGRVSAALESVVLHALARDPGQRYPSASALSAALKHALAVPDDVDALRPDAFATSPSGTSPFAKTVPSMGAPSAGAKVIVREGGGSNPPAIVTAPKAALPPRVSTLPPPDSGSRFWIVAWIVVGLVSIAAGVWLALRGAFK